MNGYQQQPLFVDSDVVDVPDNPSPGYQAVVQWSGQIHGRMSNRHTWALQAARLLDERGPDAELPPYPSPHREVRRQREETARWLHREANQSTEVCDG